MDVFSFGVLLWECLTQRQPWQDYNAMQIIFTVGVHGQRLSIPENCPSALATLMRDCWQDDAGSRPDFATILSILNQEAERMASISSPASSQVDEAAVTDCDSSHQAPSSSAQPLPVRSSCSGHE